MTTSPDQRSYLGARSRPGLALAFLLPIAACSGGGGGGPPELLASADLNGRWSITMSVTSATGPCQVAGDEQVFGSVITHDRAARTIDFDGDFGGSMRGVEASFSGTDGGAGSTQTFSGRLTFATDGSSFTGDFSLVETGTQECTAKGRLTGVRAMSFTVFPPPTQQIEYDEEIVVTFDRPIDPATVTPANIALSDHGVAFPTTLAVRGDREVTLRPTAPLPVDAQVSLFVNERLRASDGRTAGTRSDIVLHTVPVSEQFTYRFLSPDRQVALGTAASGETNLGQPDGSPGQTWRFNRIGYGDGFPVYMLRNAAFASERTLESSDGSIAALMLTYNPTQLPSGMRFIAPERATGSRLQSTFLSLHALTRTPGGDVRNLEGDSADTTWLVEAIERIGAGVPTIQLGLDQRIDSELLNTDPAGLRSDGHFAQIFQLDLAAATTVRLTLRSASEDMFLVLLSDDTFDDPSLVEWRRSTIQTDDDGGGSDPEALSQTDSRIVTPLEAGRYFVAATTFAPQQTGPFQLLATTENTAPVLAPRSAPAQDVVGRLVDPLKRAR